MLRNVRFISVVGFGTLWLCACGTSLDEGMETETFHVQDMGERLKLL